MSKRKKTVEVSAPRSATDMSGTPEMAGAAPETSADTAGSTPDPERVAQRAYELYEARGRGDGQADQDWYSAERELADRRSGEDA